MRWIVVVLAVGAAAAYAMRGPLSVGVMRRAAVRLMAANPMAELEDGIHVALCGAGSPLPDPERSGPCVGVVAGGTLFLVDAGGSASRGLVNVRMPAANITAVLLTHFHSDHIDGLGEVGLQRWVGGTHAAPLPLIGPRGVANVAAGFERAYSADAFYRTAHHGIDVAPPAGFGFEPRPFDPPRAGEDRVVWDSDGVRISAFRVEHDPVEPAVGYRFDYGGRSVVISGDTKKSAEVERVSDGVDLLVHEALAAHLVELMADAAAENNQAAREKILRDILDYHTTPVEAAQIAQASGVGHLLFYHIVPPLIIPGIERAFVDGVSDAYDGDVTLGRDGTAIFLPAGSKDVKVR
jgi:ribonuclease Z